MNRFFLALFPFFVACSGDHVEGEVIDADDFLGDTGQIIDSLSADTSSFIDLGSELNQLIATISPLYDTSAQNSFHLMDRFSYSSVQKLSFIGKNQVPYGKTTLVTPKAEFFYYTFTDSIKTMNAFYNYLDEMAAEGEGGPVKLNVDVESIKMPPLFMVVYDTVIVSVKYLCEHEKNDWSAFQDSILTIYGEDFKYQIDVDCGGPLKWK